MIPTLPLFIIIFLEGYIVLSTELLAIRMLLPFTGSGTDTVSIIIAAVLMPLAFGYYAGGQFRVNCMRGRTVRRRLIRNLTIAILLLTPGLSYVVIEWGFTALIANGWSNRLGLTALYAGLFLAIPVYLLGQTVPLVSHYFARHQLPAIAGKMLFISTLGSFMGAVFCTLVLMTWLGVHHTATMTVICMGLLIFLLARRIMTMANILASICLLFMLIANSGIVMNLKNIVSNNKYNTVQIENNPASRSIIMKLNRTAASAVFIDSDEPRFSYVRFIDESFLKPIRLSGPARSILVLGAGGLTMGMEDSKNKYVFVDIDGELKDISEKYLLQRPIGDNKSFVAVEARAYLGQTVEMFDLIILDLYRDPMSAPEYLVTKEFYQSVREHLKPGGVVVGNYFASPAFNDPFSVGLDNTFRSVFPNANRQTVQAFNIWKTSDDWANVIYSAVNNPEASTAIYTDDRNRAALDKPALLVK